MSHQQISFICAGCDLEISARRRADTDKQTSLNSAGLGALKKERKRRGRSRWPCFRRCGSLDGPPSPSPTWKDAEDPPPSLRPPSTSLSASTVPYHFNSPVFVSPGRCDPHTALLLQWPVVPLSARSPAPSISLSSPVFLYHHWQGRPSNVCDTKWSRHCRDPRRRRVAVSSEKRSRLAEFRDFKPTCHPGHSLIGQRSTMWLWRNSREIRSSASECVPFARARARADARDVLRSVDWEWGTHGSDVTKLKGVWVQLKYCNYLDEALLKRKANKIEINSWQLFWRRGTWLVSDERLQHLSRDNCLETQGIGRFKFVANFQQTQVYSNMQKC